MKLSTPSLLFAMALVTGCSSNPYSSYFKDAKQLNTSKLANSDFGSSQGVVIIRYPYYFDDSAKEVEWGIEGRAGNLNRETIARIRQEKRDQYNGIALQSIYFASALHQVFKEKYPSHTVILQPVSVYKERSREVNFNNSFFDIKSTKRIAFSAHEYPGADIYIDFKGLAPIGAPINILSQNGALSRSSHQTFGRWLALDFRVYSANAVSPKTNGILAINYRYVIQSDLEVKYAGSPFGGLHPYLITDRDTQNIDNAVVSTPPLQLNKIVFFSDHDFFVLDEERLQYEPKSGSLKDTMVEYRVLSSIVDVIKSGLSAVSKKKAGFYSSIPWVAFYDEVLANRMNRDETIPGDEKKLALLKLIEMEELKFLQEESNHLSEVVMYGDFGRNYRKVRLAENNYINEVISSHSQASNAALLAGLSTMQTQLNSYNMRGTGLSGAIGGLQTNINTLNSIAASQSSFNNSMSGISAAGAKFSAGMNAYQNQIYKFVSPSSGKTTEIKAGSLGELRYQFLKLYRAETKNLQ